MRLISLIMVIITLAACGPDENALLPGERYALDTLMAKEFATLDQRAQIECDRRRDSLFKQTYDSLFKIRAADIQMIRNAPVRQK